MNTSNEPKKYFSSAEITSILNAAAKTKGFTENDIRELRNDWAKDVLPDGGISTSNMVGGLYKRIIYQEFHAPKWRYTFGKMFGMKQLELPMAEHMYNMFTDGDKRSAYADNTIDDFNGTYDIVSTEVFEIKQEFHKKIKVGLKATQDFSTNGAAFMKWIGSVRLSLSKAIDKFVEQMIIRKIFAEATEVKIPVKDIIDDTSLTPEQKDGKVAERVSQRASLILKEYETTSLNHLGIGVDGKITVNGIEIQQELYFEGTDFNIITTPQYEVDNIYQNLAKFFNWDATKIRTGMKSVLDFNNYSPIKSTVGTSEEISIPSNLIMLMMHKEVLKPYKFFDYLSTVFGASAYGITHEFSFVDVYRMKNKPLLMFTLDETTEDTRAIENKKLMEENRKEQLALEAKIKSEIYKKGELPKAEALVGETVEEKN